MYLFIYFYSLHLGLCPNWLPVLTSVSFIMDTWAKYAIVFYCWPLWWSGKFLRWYAYLVYKKFENHCCPPMAWEEHKPLDFKPQLWLLKECSNNSCAYFLINAFWAAQLQSSSQPTISLMCASSMKIQNCFGSLGKTKENMSFPLKRLRSFRKMTHELKKRKCALWKAVDQKNIIFSIYSVTTKKPQKNNVRMF